LKVTGSKRCIRFYRTWSYTNGIKGFYTRCSSKNHKEGAVKEVVYKGSPQIHYVLGHYRIAIEMSGNNAGNIISIMGDYNVIGT